MVMTLYISSIADSAVILCVVAIFLATTLGLLVVGVVLFWWLDNSVKHKLQLVNARLLRSLQCKVNVIPNYYTPRLCITIVY